MEQVLFALLIIVSYFFGNISNARIISFFKRKDITKQGSGNPGTMNMLRTFGFKLGLLTLVLDVLKSAIPAFAGFMIFKNSEIIDRYVALYSCGLAVVIGHMFPLFYGFKGGKGVACMLGVYAVAQPLWALVVFVACFVYLLIFDYGAVASFIFITTLTTIEALRYADNIAIEVLIAVMFFLTIFMHRKNILRMLTGTENKANLIRSLKKLTKKSYKSQKKNYKQKEIG